MKNPLSSAQFARLNESIKWSERQLEFPKAERISAIKEVSGYHYATGGNPKRVIVPMLGLAVQIFIRQLAAQSPRAMVRTKFDSLKAIAANMELAVNQIPDEINLSATLRRFVMEALFSMGIVRVGLTTVAETLGHEYGQQFVDVIPLDNYFLDMSAKDMDSIQYEGNQYWMDYDDLMKGQWLDEAVKSELSPDEHTTIGLAGETRAESVSIDGSATQYRDNVWMRDIWLPKEGVVLTEHAVTNKLLKVVEWTGPKEGCYIKLGYNYLPGQLLPLAPVSTWRDLHELSNDIFRQMGHDARAQKTVLAFNGSDETGVMNFQKSTSGDGIKYVGAEPKELSAGGVNAKSLAFYLQCKDLFSYYAGNLDSIGGLGQQAPTLGQDKLLSAAAGAQMQDMADVTAKTIRKIFYHLAFYEWSDPVKQRMLKKPIPGTDETIDVSFGPQEKQGEFNQYDLDIDVYSLPDNSPSTMLQKLSAIMQTYILPLGPMIQQEGGVVGVQKILEMVAKYANFPELKDVVTFAEQLTPIAPGGAAQPSAGMPAQTNRTYTRVGQPGMSSEGSTAAITQQLLSGDGGSE